MCEKKINVPALFGEMVFGEQQMQQRLPADVYRAWQQSLAQGTALDRSVAGEIAGAMKDWAIEKGATHYTHWFQPMTGFTAEKHDSFITRDGKDGVQDSAVAIFICLSSSRATTAFCRLPTSTP